MSDNIGSNSIPHDWLNTHKSRVQTVNQVRHRALTLLRCGYHPEEAIAIVMHEYGGELDVFDREDLPKIIQNMWDYHTGDVSTQPSVYQPMRLRQP